MKEKLIEAIMEVKACTREVAIEVLWIATEQWKNELKSISRLAKEGR